VTVAKYKWTHQELTDQAVLVVHGKDRPGIVATITAILSKHEANIVSLDHHSDDPQGGTGDFFQRTVFSRPSLKATLPQIDKELHQELHALTYTLRELAIPKRVAIFASREDHCLLDLLWRHRRGELPISVPMVISNHTDAADEVR